MWYCRIPLFFAFIACICAPVMAGAQNFPPAWNAAAHYAAGDQVQENGNVFRCTHAVTAPNLDPAKAYYWELWEVRLNTTLLVGVGQTFPTLSAAWAYGLSARIVGGAYLHYYVVTTAGAYLQTLTTGLSLNHPFGANISIIGDSKAGNEFYMPSGSSGFSIDSGHNLAALINLQIIGSNSTNSGISVSGNARIGLVSNCYLNGFVMCIHAYDGGCLNCDKYVTFSGPVIPVWRTAIKSESGARVTLAPFLAIDGTNNSISGPVGLDADDGGVIVAEQCTVIGCAANVEALRMGFVDIDGGTVGKGQYNLYANSHGFITADNIQIYSASGVGVYCVHDSHITMTFWNGDYIATIGDDGSVLVSVN